MDDRRRDGGTNSTLRTKEQGTHLTLNEHDDDDDDEKKFLTWPRVEPRFCGLPLRSLVTGSAELSSFHWLNCLKECIFLNQRNELIKIQ